MRHLGSLLVAAVFAPSIFLLTGTGLSAFHSALDDNKMYDPLGSLAAFGILLLAGVLYAILVMARISPLGPGLAGLASWGISGWALLDIKAYQELFSHLNIHMGGALGETGLGILLGVPLVATIFTGRWRRSESYPQQFVRSPTDPAWVLPAAPVPDIVLPDTAPPSLRYPAASAFPAPSPAPSWRTPPYIPPVAEPEASSAVPPESVKPVSGQPVSAPPVSAPPVRHVGGPPEPAHLDFSTLDEISQALRPVSGPPAQITMAALDGTSPLPRRVPAAPAGPSGRAEVAAPIVSPPPPPDNEETERLGPPGSISPQSKRGGKDDKDETASSLPES
jgi:hypothetical protein